MLNSEIEFVVQGLPISQGSMKSFGNGRMVHSNKNLKAWRTSVFQAGAIGSEQYGFFAQKEMAVRMELLFMLPHPKTVMRVRHTVRPDLDKLIRAIGDALSGACYVDDSQIVTIIAHKRYIVGNEIPGVLIILKVIG